MTDLLLVKIEDGLHPTDGAGIETMRLIPENSIVRVRFSVPRNIRHHRMFFALLTVAFEGQTEPRLFPTTSHLLDAIKVATGHVREFKDLHGRIHIVPDSISFGRMDQIQFRQWFDAAVDVILTNVLRGTKRRDLEQRIADILHEPGPEQINR